jgi:hypothetical protein
MDASRSFCSLTREESAAYEKSAEAELGVDCARWLKTGGETTLP